MPEKEVWQLDVVVDTRNIWQLREWIETDRKININNIKTALNTYGNNLY